MDLIDLDPTQNQSQFKKGLNWIPAGENLFSFFFFLNPGSGLIETGKWGITAVLVTAEDRFIYAVVSSCDKHVAALLLTPCRQAAIKDIADSRI